MSSLNKVADAICKADGNNPDYVTWVDYEDHAKAALEALIDRQATDPAEIARNRWINEIIYNPERRFK